MFCEGGFSRPAGGSEDVIYVNSAKLSDGGGGAAARVECAVYCEVSRPAADKVFLAQRTRVSEDAVLCGCREVMKRFETCAWSGVVKIV